ncbi:MAG: VWA domain-containing protein [Hyphomicrobiales bacterium]|nr:VWA domain-containing protein [Hyphomicrobiales bacterium]
MAQVPNTSARADGVQSRTEVDAFLDKAGRAPVMHEGRGRLIFALDATMSRQPTWDMAQGLQQRMFQETGKLGGLDVQLVYFRGLSECKASRFVSQGAGLAALMAKIDCRGGETQIEKVLRHTRDEARIARVGALIFVGDAMEEKVDRLCMAAGELAMLGVKAFMFHEGADSAARNAFQEIARLTGGAYAAFDASAPQRLAALLGAAAAYAAGGYAALEAKAKSGDSGAQLLLGQMGRK